LRIFNDHSIKYCSKSRKDHINTQTTVKTPAVHDTSTPMHHESILARARKLAGIK
jgi:hypothetical protein